ncbi:MAG: tyrosine protein kinase:aminoglycoside phosphotransferase [Candidatus Binatia bacterium]|nr:MAG: tyrosine protein kinase:aminoglycoside phosphotransferase [Candidatus Binatia bacterium]
MTTEEMRKRLASFVAAREGVREVRIEGLRPLPGGASRETWSFDAVYERGGAMLRLPLVLRRDPPGRGETSRREEFLVLRTAYECGLPVPRPYWLGDDEETLGGRFLVMERVEGETIPRRLLRDELYARAREVLPAQLAECLARIHRIELGREELRGLPAPRRGESVARAEIDRYENLYRLVALEPHPALELAFRWLRSRAPVASRLALVHGDFRIGNVVFGPEGLRAVLDWELAHVGDPMEDLGWLCVRAWRFGRDEKAVGGLADREEFYAAYENAGGFPVDLAAVRFWEAFGNLKWAVICLGQARVGLEGQRKNLELGSLGRRTAEVEWELLELMEEETCRTAPR